MKPPTRERVDAGSAGEWEEGLFEEGEARWGVGVWEGVGESISELRERRRVETDQELFRL